MSKDLIIIADYTENAQLTASELCEILRIEYVDLQNYVTYEIVIPVETKSNEWVFDMTQLSRLRMAQRLRRDFELNMSGIALVLELLQEIDTLRAESDLLHKHIFK